MIRVSGLTYIYKDPGLKCQLYSIKMCRFAESVRITTNDFISSELVFISRPAYDWYQMGCVHKVNAFHSDCYYNYHDLTLSFLYHHINRQHQRKNQQTRNQRIITVRFFLDMCSKLIFSYVIFHILM